MDTTSETPNDDFDVRTFAGYQAACAAWLRKGRLGECGSFDVQRAVAVITQLREYAVNCGAADTSELKPEVKHTLEKLSAEVDELRETVAGIAATARARDVKLGEGVDRTLELVQRLAARQILTQVLVAGLEANVADVRERAQAWSVGVDVKLEAAGVALRQCGEAGLDLTRLVEDRTQALRHRATNSEHRIRVLEETSGRDLVSIVKLSEKVAKLLPQDHPYDYDGNGCRKCGGPTSAIHPRVHTMQCAGLGSNYDEKRFVPCDCEGVAPVQHPTSTPLPEGEGLDACMDCGAPSPCGVDHSAVHVDVEG